MYIVACKVMAFCSDGCTSITVNLLAQLVVRHRREIRFALHREINIIPLSALVLSFFFFLHQTALTMKTPNYSVLTVVQIALKIFSEFLSKSETIKNFV